MKQFDQLRLTSQHEANNLSANPAFFVGNYMVSAQKIKQKYISTEIL